MGKGEGSVLGGGGSAAMGLVPAGSIAPDHPPGPLAPAELHVETASNRGQLPAEASGQLTAGKGERV